MLDIKYHTKTRGTTRGWDDTATRWIEVMDRLEQDFSVTKITEEGDETIIEWKIRKPVNPIRDTAIEAEEIASYGGDYIILMDTLRDEGRGGCIFLEGFEQVSLISKLDLLDDWIAELEKKREELVNTVPSVTRALLING